MKTTEENWVSFWFEGNLYFDWVNNQNDWKRLLDIYSSHYDINCILDAKNCPQSNKPKYGFVIECSGNKTLREFFIDNNMKYD